MLIHVGDDIMLEARDIIALLDAESAAQCDATRGLLRTLAADGRLGFLPGSAARSYIIYTKDGQTAAYASPVSTSTLYKRAGRLPVD